MAKTVADYLGLPYTIELRNTPGEGWFVRVKELPGCMSQGETAEEALVMIRDAMQGWLEVALEYGDPIPEPRPDEEFSGKFVVRVPRTLHRELVSAAESEGASLNQFINTVLAQAVGRATSHRGAGSPPPAGLFDPLVRRLEEVVRQFELAVAGRPALPDAQSSQEFLYRSQQSAQLALHEGQALYQADAAQPSMMAEEASQPDAEAAGETP